MKAFKKMFSTVLTSFKMLTTIIVWQSNSARSPSLAVCFANNGLVQIFEHERDEVPVLVETQLRIAAARWSPDGRLLAVAGVSLYDFW